MVHRFLVPQFPVISISNLQPGTPGKIPCLKMQMKWSSGWATMGHMPRNHSNNATSFLPWQYPYLLYPVVAVLHSSNDNSYQFISGLLCTWCSLLHCCPAISWKINGPNWITRDPWLERQTSPPVGRRLQALVPSWQHEKWQFAKAAIVKPSFR